MKRFAICFSLLLLTVAASAQRNALYLLDDFTPGTVLMHNKAKVNAPFNYDAANRQMKYEEKGEVMILTNTGEIDTLYIGDRKFIPANRLFLEVVELPNGKAYINWKLKELNKGKVGAYGQVSQSTTKSNINVSYYNKGLYQNEKVDVTEVTNENDYWLFRNSKPLKFRNEKGLIKLFPSHEAAIRTYIKEQKTAFEQPDQVLELLNHCLGL